ncbi:hypothetical protein OBA47_01370 [bacterium]|nr:hypothetical protein [bacterium]
MNRSETDEVTHLELGERIAVEPKANVEVVDPAKKSRQAEFVVLLRDLQRFRSPSLPGLLCEARRNPCKGSRLLGYS